MFGMLDYRAQKLFWLLSLPLATLAVIAPYAAIPFSAVLSDAWTKVWYYQILLAYVLFEGGVFVFSLVYKALMHVLEKTFFWLIEIIPSQGEDIEEAKIIATNKCYSLNKKLLSQTDKWTEQDTKAYSRLFNWRARLFFNVPQRVRAMVGKIEDLHFTAPINVEDVHRGDLKNVFSLDWKWYEALAVSTPIFRSLVAVSIFLYIFL
ncbi:membrane protein of unknown function [Pseudodesulfovibrio profundus]|uniref:Uncharacterized protein n=1 Tax=Pseudodesulfovibrio profundus TaxID=57320 RepID=A0A2C8FFE3_9BACT|nr:hypothetical protein [Pseudodesulfovibrio profundus]SOB60608.1 membrane protein of unknown function [Pseudodesulfovibrio profundus]